jgi:hypothetical protein
MTKMAGALMAKRLLLSLAFGLVATLVVIAPAGATLPHPPNGGCGEKRLTKHKSMAWSYFADRQCETPKVAAAKPHVAVFEMNDNGEGGGWSVQCTVPGKPPPNDGGDPGPSKLVAKRSWTKGGKLPAGKTVTFKKFPKRARNCHAVSYGDLTIAVGHGSLFKVTTLFK